MTPFLILTKNNMSRFFLCFFLLCFSSSSASPSASTSGFLDSLQTTLAAIDQVSSVVSQVGNLFGDSRLSYALSDCLDLLDSSADALQWSSAATQSPKGKHNSTGDLSSDLKTWVGAAISNMDTCSDGFEGTNGIARQVVSGSLGQVTSMLSDLLASVGTGRGKSANKSKNVLESTQMPSWVNAELLQGNGVTPDVTVAADGSGNFKTVTEAVEAAPEKSLNRFVIYIKSGVYKENVEIKKKKWNIVMVGDGINNTIISGNRSFIDGWTTFRSATFAVSGRGFLARDITFENTAGPEKHQAVALRSDSDLAVFFRCAMRGYQDTLYTHTMRQFFRDCQISGTVDFIFGDGTVVFQNCQILAKKGLPNQKNTITAQGRKDPNQPTGFSIQFCNITADADLLPFVNSTSTYLGRPWKLYSRTVIMQSYMSPAIRPEGWLEWNGNFALDTLLYAEYMNYGPGAGLGRRVKWPGYRVLNGSSEANNYTVGQFIEGDLWLPSTGVKYVSGLAV